MKAKLLKKLRKENSSHYRIFKGLYGNNYVVKYYSSVVGVSEVGKFNKLSDAKQCVIENVRKNILNDIIELRLKDSKLRGIKFYPW